MADDDKTRGLYRKYMVKRQDGSGEPGGKHAFCHYFVLDLDHDTNSAPALLAYVEACEDEYPALAEDLRRELVKRWGVSPHAYRHECKSGACGEFVCCMCGKVEPNCRGGSHDDAELDEACEACYQIIIKAREWVRARPVQMLLWCPACGKRHIDVGAFATQIKHHTHACQECGMTWRPALGPTVGVQFLPGFRNH